MIHILHSIGWGLLAFVAAVELLQRVLHEYDVLGVGAPSVLIGIAVFFLTL